MIKNSKIDFYRFLASSSPLTHGQIGFLPNLVQPRTQGLDPRSPLKTLGTRLNLVRKFAESEYESGARFTESGAHFTESGAHFTESGAHFTESGAHFTESTNVLCLL